uniref:Photosystem II reaction center protein Z n=1 Tax=Gloeochaete wittrockiana TaxID=38269 RepID=A0A3G1IVZ2_9EUKA|nr:photosystem II protein Z [Gloeochaete wittrockiana]ASQ40210.1 photosystem II protein Z [Gloeochaete wittrockiana]
MLVAFQLALTFLVLLSFVLVVGIPVLVASAGEWERSQKYVYVGAFLWASLVIITGLLNSFIS